MKSHAIIRKCILGAFRYGKAAIQLVRPRLLCWPLSFIYFAPANAKKQSWDEKAICFLSMNFRFLQFLESKTEEFLSTGFLVSSCEKLWSLHNRMKRDQDKASLMLQRDELYRLSTREMPLGEEVLFGLSLQFQKVNTLPKGKRIQLYPEKELTIGKIVWYAESTVR